MSDTCETVKIVNPAGGFFIINKSDLTDEHVLFDAAEGEAEVKKPRKKRDAD